MHSDGKNTVRVNGVPVNLAMLKSIGECLVNIHGQHDNTSLLSVKSHRGFLDRFAGEPLKEALENYQLIHRECNLIETELEDICTDEQEKLRRRDMLSFQLEELDDADLVAGEDAELEAKKLLMDNASKITDNTSAAYEMLYGSDSGAVHDLLWTAVNKLEEISDFNGEIKEIYSALSETSYLLDEQIRELKFFCDHTSFDRSEAEEVENRLELIYTLKRKYGNTIEEILEFRENAREELEKIETSDARAKDLEKRLEICIKERERLAAELTNLRRKASMELSERVKRQLADLNMAKVDFGVIITRADFGEHGADSVEFTVCTNVGEEMKPLAKIASGGELSRIMLAIKNVLAGYDHDKTVIFDEIDTGVSGNAAQKIGEKLYSMSLGAQVLCITHLPQISALADNHYLIQKEISGDRTRTSVVLLDRDGRIEEIARTLGGATISVVTRENARQLLDEAEVIKQMMKSPGR